MPVLTTVRFMLSAWLLPEHIADVLPAQARRIEELRRALLDRARGYGFELVMPPLLEHLDALLSGTGRGLDLQTFKLVDQLSGRMLGLRADTTPQAARIDAHLLNRQGVTRLCYCGPVLHTLPAGVTATREPLQFGAEIFGHAGLEADLEAAELALDGLQAACPGRDLVIELADARVLRGVLAGVDVAQPLLHEIVQALTEKDASALAQLTTSLPAAPRAALQALLHLYGEPSVLQQAQQQLPAHPLVQAALQQLSWLGSHLQASYPGVKIGYDLSDLSGHAYYSGLRFVVYGAGCTDSLVRGGRYDEVGAVFGRNRPAVGFSLDLKALAEAAAPTAAGAAICAPWGEDPGLRAAVRQLRQAGETVVSAPLGVQPETQAFVCDRELVRVAGQWVLRALEAQPQTQAALAV
jgi:ATP phosphoribosyltransferase regulatory subunit